MTLSLNGQVYKKRASLPAQSECLTIVAAGRRGYFGAHANKYIIKPEPVIIKQYFLFARKSLFPKQRLSGRPEYKPQ